METGDDNGTACFIMFPLAVLALREQRKIKNAVFCEESSGFRPYTFTSHTKTSIVFGMDQ